MNPVTTAITDPDPLLLPVFLGIMRDRLDENRELIFVELGAHDTLDSLEMSRQLKFSGFPVVENGIVVGIVTNRDLRFEENLDQPLRNIMTPQERQLIVKLWKAQGGGKNPKARPFGLLRDVAWCLVNSKEFLFRI